jgi:hypothetical protein
MFGLSVYNQIIVEFQAINSVSLQPKVSFVSAIGRAEGRVANFYLLFENLQEENVIIKLDGMILFFFISHGTHNN